MAKSRKNKSNRRKKGTRQRQSARSSWWGWALIVGGTLVVIVFVVAALRFTGTRAGTYYPPTDIIGHQEISPPSHILDRPMSIPMFKHMLEHSDGSGPPGVIISYNCENYECEPNLVDRLRAIAEEYPTFVYLAPFPDMNAKIAVTRRGRQIVLDTLDEERIRAFIEQK